MRAQFTVSVASHRRRYSRLLVVVLIATGCGTSIPAPQLDELSRTVKPFEVYWPPVDPESTVASARRPLLEGQLTVAVEPSTGAPTALRASATLVRPSSEADRLYWNKSLEFADINWMSEVRVWDVQQHWLWPNLPFMLRLPGQERVERYGGVDPGKHVDNDFAAVLIRMFDAAGEVESMETKHAPLVSAEWHAVDSSRGNGQSIRHVARSDDFVVHFHGPNNPSRGKLKVWLIYADFLGYRPPPSWPRTPEYAGGILAYFEMDWEMAGGSLRAAVRHLKPTAATGFDWAAWVRPAPGGDASTASFRLSNR